MTPTDEIEQLLDRIEELELMQHALQQMSEALALFLKPVEPVEDPPS